MPSRCSIFSCRYRGNPSPYFEIATWANRPGAAKLDHGRRPGLNTDEQARVKELQRENRELRRANEILRKASAYFAQAELDRRPK